MVLVKPLEPQKIFDLDNLVAFEDRTVLGFVLELVGPVTMPLYSIQFYPIFSEKLQAKAQGVLLKEATGESVEPQKPPNMVEIYKRLLHGEKTFIVKRTMKMITH